MAVSQRELVSHVVRRLGIGSHGTSLADLDSVDDALVAALDLSTSPAPPPEILPPADVDEARLPEQRLPPAEYWFAQMLDSPRLIEERLVWFWHDHFATSLRKIRFPFLMWQQHLTIRRHATGNFAELLHAIATDPAMLLYLDGVDNRAGAINENFGREVMELFTMGRGAYTEADVVACAAACSGWVVFIPRPERTRAHPEVQPWSSVFVPPRHDDGIKTFLGATGALDLPAAMDVILERPETAQFISAKLYQELAGRAPSAVTAPRLAAAFAGYDILALVEAIVEDPSFLAEEAVAAKVRTPLERVINAVQGFGGHDRTLRAMGAYLETVGYLPWAPPNVAGFPEGPRLLGPHSLVHAFDSALAVGPEVPDIPGPDMLARLGLFDVSSATLDVLGSEPDPATRLALALNSPEHALV